MDVYSKNIHCDYERVESGKRVRDSVRGREGGKGCQTLKKQATRIRTSDTQETPSKVANIKIQYIFCTIFCLFFGGVVSVDTLDTTLPPPLLGPSP